jgi:hypothetical protein
MLLFILLSPTIGVKAQSKSGKQPATLPFKIYSTPLPNSDNTGLFEATFNLQERAILNYKKNGMNWFIIIESILNEIFKPEPAINKNGFHGSATPFLEIQETKGNTGFIKLGMMIDLSFK